jgi:hypothetical protein
MPNLENSEDLAVEKISEEEHKECFEIADAQEKSENETATTQEQNGQENVI